MPPVKIGEIDTMSDDLGHVAPLLRRYMPGTSMANMSGQPSMSVPLAWSGKGLPLGMMFTAHFGDEAMLFRLAGQLEQIRPWKDKRPPIYRLLTQNDPTDHALAAIASILDHKETHETKDKEPEIVHAAEIFSVVRETITATAVSEPEATSETEATVVEHQSPTTISEPVEVDGSPPLAPA
eukprot:gene65242-89257_t